jgi:hypothetical protein
LNFEVIPDSQPTRSITTQNEQGAVKIGGIVAYESLSNEGNASQTTQPTGNDGLF